MKKLVCMVLVVSLLLCFVGVSKAGDTKVELSPKTYKGLTLSLFFISGICIGSGIALLCTPNNQIVGGVAIAAGGFGLVKVFTIEF